MPKENQKDLDFTIPTIILKLYIEIRNERFNVNDEVSRINKSQNVIIEEVRIDIHLVTSPLRIFIIV